MENKNKDIIYYYIRQFMNIKNQIFNSLYGSDIEEPKTPYKYQIEAKIGICERVLREQKQKLKRIEYNEKRKQKRAELKKQNELKKEYERWF